MGAGASVVSLKASKRISAIWEHLMTDEEKETVVGASEGEFAAVVGDKEKTDELFANLVKNMEEEYAVGYTGDCNKRGGKQGWGREVYEDGIYEGSFYNNRRHGQGTYMNTSGDKYEGPWKAGCMHGKNCKYTFGDGSLYEGEMQFDKFSSMSANPSILKHISGSVYTGRFRDGLKQGYGKMYYANGDSYEGYWMKDKQHTTLIEEPREFRVLATPAQLKKKEDKPPESKEKSEKVEKKTKTLTKGYSWSNSNVEITMVPVEMPKPVIEESKEDERDSWTYVEGDHGIYTWKGDGNYIGGFKDNHLYGYGIRTWASGVRYRGYFEKDLQHGEGIIEFPDGRRHQGVFRFGDMVSSSNVIHKYPVKDPTIEVYGNDTNDLLLGATYEGEWLYEKGLPDGVPCGKGVMVYGDKSAYKGEFKSGLREGFGTMLYPDHSSYYGEWLGGDRDGEGIFIYGNRSGIYDGGWLCDRKFGFGTLTYGDKPLLDAERKVGDVFEGMFENDKKVGAGRVKDRDGNILEEFTGIYNEDKVVKKQAVEFPTDPEVAHRKILELLAQENEMGPASEGSEVVVWRKDSMDFNDPQVIDLSFQQEYINEGDIIEVYDFTTNQLVKSYVWKGHPSYQQVHKSTGKRGNKRIPTIKRGKGSMKKQMHKANKTQLMGAVVEGDEIAAGRETR